MEALFDLTTLTKDERLAPVFTCFPILIALKASVYKRYMLLFYSPNKAGAVDERNAAVPPVRPQAGAACA